AGIPVTGVTVHIANERFDDGPILAQVEVPILPDDTLETLEARIHEAEHKLLPRVIATLKR
ncbi:MAG: phosphoribosylglycinamide formyltransferase, partial [Actinomycetia bacterium]|nr:phosphoribosylglycinamide formyltransferase [Actinomycetes bacterium]